MLFSSRVRVVCYAHHHTYLYIFALSLSLTHKQERASSFAIEMACCSTRIYTSLPCHCHWPTSKRERLPLQWRWSAVPSLRELPCDRHPSSCQTRRCNKLPRPPEPKLRLPTSSRLSTCLSWRPLLVQLPTNHDLSCTGLRRINNNSRRKYSMTKQSLGIEDVLK